MTNQTSNPQIAAALFKVESTHHIHGQQCLCGFQSAVSRDRTRHIMEATLAAAEPRTITDERGSDSLPIGSIVLDCNGDIARKFPGGWRTTVTEPDGRAWLSGCMEDADLPATVLYEPETSK